MNISYKINVKILPMLVGIYDIQIEICDFYPKYEHALTWTERGPVNRKIIATS